MNQIEHAINLSQTIHKNDKRKGGEPYFNHCKRVYEIVKKYTSNEDILIASLLHDGPEDHPDDISFKDLQLAYNFEVSNLVYELTNKFTKETHPKLNREKRKKLENERLSKISNEAKLIKAADRLDNVQCWIKEEEIPDYYRAETLDLIDKIKTNENHSIIEEIKRLIND